MALPTINLKPEVSTFKLTPVDVRAKCGLGKLVAWTPAGPGAFLEKRTVFLHPDVAELFNANPWPKDRQHLDDRPTDRRRQFHAIMRRFVTGAAMVIKSEIKLLQPTSPEFADLWEFRSMAPDPQTRLLGYLVSPGCFVALWFGMRRDLGDFDDIRWSDAARECQKRFEQIFPGASPLRSVWPLKGRADLRNYLDE